MPPESLMKDGGTDFDTHALKQISTSRVEFKVSDTALLFCGIIMAIGIILIIWTTIKGLEENIQMIYMGVPGGAIFFIVGFFLFSKWTTPQVFDLDAGYYWKGKKEPGRMDMLGIKEHCRLRDIYAIQLLQESCRGKNSYYYSYELNLVLKDGARLNVLDHGQLFRIRADAEKLSQFLGVPVWDAIFR